MFYFVVTLSVALVILFSLIFHTLKNGISPMPTTEKVKRALFEVLPDLDDGVIIDLGSGWGNLIFPLAKKYEHCHIFGYENSPVPYWFSSMINHKKNLKIRRSDFFNVPLHDADMVVCYLFPKGMEELKAKFEKELKPGTHVVSHTFAIPGWKPKTVIEVNDLHSSKIYLYEVAS